MATAVRRAMTWGGAAVLTLVLAGCVGTPLDALSADPGAGNGTSASPSKNDDANHKGEGPDESAAQSELSCHWDTPALTRENKPDEGGQQGEPTERVLNGAWQQVGYDSGDGYVSFMKKDYRDYRFFFDGNTFLFCQDTPETDKGERRGTVELTGTELALKPDDGTYTLLTWGDDTMTWRNHFGDATIYLERR